MSQTSRQLGKPSGVPYLPWEIAQHVFMIGEIGINHNGDLGIAKQLILMAKDCGCDAVKFQKRTIDIVYPPDVLDQPRESPWGTTQRDQKEHLEFGESDYDEIDRFCRDIGIAWFASAWDIPSQVFLRKYDLPYNKIASAMTTHHAFLHAVASEKKLTFVSTGMCTLEDIDAAVAIFAEHECPIVIMHTVSTYPSPIEDLNLSTIGTLRQRYNLPVGYSGHEASVTPSLVAAMLGAVAIERHITINRAMYGSDQAASLEKAGLEGLVTRLRVIPQVLGDGVKRTTDGEQKVAQKLRYWL